MIPFQLPRRIPVIRRPFYQRDRLREERDALTEQLVALRLELQRFQSNSGERHSPVEQNATVGYATSATVEQHWDKQNEAVGEALPNSVWWLAPIVIRHINRIVCGEPIDGMHAGFHRRLAAAMADAPRPGRALSVGCGLGTKEMDAIAAGAADVFECYDISASAINGARSIAAERGLSHRITFHHADINSCNVGTGFDLVYWNNSLHHMFDTHAFVAWSRDSLRDGGLFAMDDYVGATRFQHSPELVAWCNRLLASLPEYLRRHWNGRDNIPPFSVCDPKALACTDPSECADSGAILPAVRSIFPRAEVIKTGGAAYIALSNALQNFRSETEIALLNAILLADEEVSYRVERQYAVA
jgi:SAM-dependent methyltransferase